MIGKILDGRYRITDILGAGAFGQTYLAEDLRRPGNPQCVVKQLCPASNGSISLDAAHRLFKREAETLEKLGRHDKIPQLLAYFAENQRFYLVKEFTPGHPLTQEVVVGIPLSEEQVFGILSEVLEILVFVHNNRVIHRDIKPANLIRRAVDKRLVLIDFGSVKEITSQIIQAQGPWTIAAGTPAYMPVEQFRGNPQFNSDIYALGMIAVQALTGLAAGELPKLQDPNSNKTMWRHRASVSPQLADIIDKMIHPHYGQRYQTVSDVLVHLKKLRPAEGIVPPSTIITQHELPAKQPPKRSLILAGIGIILGLAGLIIWSIRPEHAKSQRFYNRAVERADKGDQQGAITDYTHAIRFNPQDAEAYYKRGNAHYELGNLDSAIEDYNQAIKQNPNYADAYYNRGLAKYEQGALRNALEDFNHVIRLTPNDGEAYYKRGVTYFDLKDYQTAIGDFTEAIRLNPNDADAYQARGLARSAGEDKKGALADYTQAIEINPQDVEAYYSRGRARFFLADYQGAAQDYSRAIELNSEFSEAYSSRCGAYLNLGEYQKAVSDCTQAIQFNAQDAVAYDNRCIAHLNLGRHSSAIEDCTQAIQLNSTNAKAYSNRGLARSSAGDHAGAVEDYTQAIRLNPSDAIAYSNRGTAYTDQSNFTNAIADYAQAIRLNPTFASAYVGRGLARAQLGDKAGAIEDLQKAATLYLEQGRPSAYKDVQQHLNKLR